MLHAVGVVEVATAIEAVEAVEAGSETADVGSGKDMVWAPLLFTLKFFCPRGRDMPIYPKDSLVFTFQHPSPTREGPRWGYYWGEMGLR